MNTSPVTSWVAFLNWPMNEMHRRPNGDWNRFNNNNNDNNNNSIEERLEWDFGWLGLQWKKASNWEPRLDFISVTSSSWAAIGGGDELVGPLKTAEKLEEWRVASVAWKESSYSDGCLLPLNNLKCPRRRRRRRSATSRSARRRNVCTIWKILSLFSCRTSASSLWWWATASWEPSPSKPWLFHSFNSYANQLTINQLISSKSSMTAHGRNQTSIGCYRKVRTR